MVVLRGFHGDVHTEIKNTVNHSCSKDLGNFGKNLGLYLPTQLSQEPAEIKEKCSVEQLSYELFPKG